MYTSRLDSPTHQPEQALSVRRLRNVMSVDVLEYIAGLRNNITEVHVDSTHNTTAVLH